MKCFCCVCGLSLGLSGLGCGGDDDDNSVGWVPNADASAGSGGASGAGGSGGSGGGDSGPLPDARPPPPDAQPPPPPLTCDFYVDQSQGNDSNDGSSEGSAWQTIQKAADSLGPGDTVCIRAGTYSEHVLVQNDGADNQPITFAAYPGEDPTLDGTGVNVEDGDGLFEVNGKSHIRISGLRVVNSPWAGILVRNAAHIVIDSNFTLETKSSGIGVWRSHDVLVDGNEVRRARNAPGGAQEWITMGSTPNFEIRNNHIHDGEDLEHVICIDVKHGSDHGKVYGNFIHNVSGLGIYVDGWDTLTQDLDIFGNFLMETGSAIVLSSERGGPVENVRVFNNVIVRSRFVGIGLMTSGQASGGDGPRNHIQIYHNTIGEALAHGGAGIFVQSTNVSDIQIWNNLVSYGTNHVGQIRATSPALVTADHNLVFGALRYPDEELSGSIEADPLLVDPAATTAEGLKVQAGSPAIDQGRSDGAPADDYEGSPRPLDGDGSGSAEHDIGAFEFPAQ